MSAALNAIIKDTDFLFQVGGTPATVEGLLTGRFSLNRNLVRTVAGAPTNYQEHCLGLVGAEAVLQGGWNETNAECSNGATLQWDGANDMAGVIGYRLVIEATEVDVSTLASSGFLERRPGRQRVSLDFNGRYYDVLGTSAYWDEVEGNIISGGADITATLGFGSGSTFTIPGKVEQLNIERGDDDYMNISGRLQSEGAYTDGTAGATNLDLLMTSMTAGSSIAVRATAVTAGMTRYDFTGYTVRYEINVQNNNQISYNIRLVSDGAVTSTLIV